MNNYINNLVFEDLLIKYLVIPQFDQKPDLSAQNYMFLLTYTNYPL